MKRMLMAGVALATVLGLAGPGEAQTGRGAPVAGGPLIGIEPMTNPDATVTDRDDPGSVTIDLGSKMINCNTPGAPSGGSTGTVPSPFHPCR